MNETKIYFNTIAVDVVAIGKILDFVVKVEVVKIRENRNNRVDLNLYFLAIVLQKMVKGIGFEVVNKNIKVVFKNDSDFEGLLTVWLIVFNFENPRIVNVENHDLRRVITENFQVDTVADKNVNEDTVVMLVRVIVRVKEENVRPPNDDLLVKTNFDLNRVPTRVHAIFVNAIKLGLVEPNVVDVPIVGVLNVLKTIEVSILVVRDLIANLNII